MLLENEGSDVWRAFCVEIVSAGLEFLEMIGACLVCGDGECLVFGFELHADHGPGLGFRVSHDALYGGVLSECDSRDQVHGQAFH